MAYNCRVVIPPEAQTAKQILTHASVGRLNAARPAVLAVTISKSPTPPGHPHPVLGALQGRGKGGGLPRDVPITGAEARPLTWPAGGPRRSAKVDLPQPGKPTRISRTGGSGREPSRLQVTSSHVRIEPFVLCEQWAKVTISSAGQVVDSKTGGTRARLHVCVCLTIFLSPCLGCKSASPAISLRSRPDQ